MKRIPFAKAAFFVSVAAWLLLSPSIARSQSVRWFDGPLLFDSMNPLVALSFSPPFSAADPVTELTLTYRTTGHGADCREAVLFRSNAAHRLSPFHRLASAQPEALSLPESDAPPRSTLMRLHFRLKSPFRPSLLYPKLILALQFGPATDGLATVSVDSLSLYHGDRSRTLTPEAPKVFRMALALRKRGDDGVPGYRIPGMVTTRHGTLICVYDVRRVASVADLPNNIDIGMSRSSDGGLTWEPMKIIMDMGNETEIGAKGNGIGDPSILYDPETDTLWVAAVWSHGNRAWWGSGQGMSPDETGQLMLTHSRDDGKSWSPLQNITPQLKDPGWHYLLQGPGIGITLADGTLVFPAQYQDATPERVPFSTIMYSRDRGASWKIVPGPRSHTTESQVVQLSNGDLMLNCRDDRNRAGERAEIGGRAVYTTADLGQSWVLHPSSDFTLPEPNCQASLLKLPMPGREGKATLAFFNPNAHRNRGVDGGQKNRAHFALQISRDDGITWEKKIVLDPNPGRGYSSMSVVGSSLAIVYEGSKADLVFQTLSLAELMQP